MRGFLVLALAVLAAIGAGVGVEAGVAPAVYGPSGARFRAAFPAPPRVRTVTLHGRGGVAEEVVGTAHGEQLVVEASAVPLARGRVTFGPSTAYASSVSLGLGPGRNQVPLTPVRIDGARGLLGTLCTHPGRCASLLVGLAIPSGRQVGVWSASAAAPTRHQVRALLGSLRPVRR